MATRHGKSVTAVADAVAVAARMEVRPVEVHWSGRRRQTAGVATLQDALEAAEEEEVPTAVAGSARSRVSCGRNLT